MLAIENKTVKLIAIDTPFGKGVGVFETYYELNGGDIQIYETPIQLRKRKNTIEFWSVDKINKEEVYRTFRYTFDNIPPTVKITRPEGRIYLFEKKSLI